MRPTSPAPCTGSERTVEHRVCGCVAPGGHGSAKVSVGTELVITVGSVSREDAARRFPFLVAKFAGSRSATKEFTHRDPDYVFWIYPDGRLHDARDAHRGHVPRGYEHILDDEPDYGGFLRGRVASLGEDQLVVVYCRPEALDAAGEKLGQFLAGIRELPVPLRDDALVISDNGNFYGTVGDLYARAS